MTQTINQKKAIIIGAGPAGLTAAYELLEHTDIKPIIYEMSHDIGGISKTVNYKGYRMDIGGHRFFSKSDVVMNWWLNILPIEHTSDSDITINYQNKSRKIEKFNDRQNSGDPNLVMLVRNRKSRILWLNAHGWYVENIAAHFDWHEKTVTKVLRQWKNLGLEGLWESPGRGGKPKWKDSDIIFLEECLRQEPRTYNSSQLALKLKTERNVQMSPDRLRRVLKKRGLIGSGQERATKENKTR